MSHTTKKFEYNSASLQLSIFDNGMASVSHVFAKERRQGHASGVMQMVCEYADEHNLVLNLEVRRYGHPIGPDNATLIEFYSKFGFVMTRKIKDRTTVNSHYYFMSRPVEN